MKECPICGVKMICMTPQHAKVHGKTMEEMRSEFKVDEYSHNGLYLGSLSITKPWVRKVHYRRNIR